MSALQLPVQIETLCMIGPRLEVYYPVISGWLDPFLEQRINHTILSLVYELIKKQGYYENPLTEITAFYEIKTNEKGVLSLSIINYAFSGGAHGMTINKSLTFDIHTGKEYKLKDLFKKNSNYVKILSDIIEQQIVEREIPVLGEYIGIRPDQDYYISDKVLVVYFQLYELAPYVYGFPSFPISVYEIEDIINEKSPLGKMM